MVRIVAGRNLPGHVPGQMNKTEERYARHLEELRLAGDVVKWRFEEIKFKVGRDTKKCWWTPDFAVWYKDGILEIVDVKGGRRPEQAEAVKLKVVAAEWPEFRFVVATWAGTKYGWDRKVVA